MSQMKLSCSAIAWGKVNDEESFKKILRTIKDVGYEGVGIEYNLLPPTLMKDTEGVKRIADSVGLSVPSMAITENLASQGEAAAKMGAESGWLCLFEKDANAAASLSKMLAKAFDDEGLKVAIHPHIRSNVESEAQLDALMSACSPLPVAVCFDSAHQEDLGFNLSSFIKKYKDKIVLVHLKDLRSRVDPKKVDFDHDFVDLGEGVVDFGAVFKTLREVDYRGWLMVEVDFAHEETVEESVRKNFDYVTSFL
ncbi:MAG TPA: sugar phosphate isomerase/epimerase [Nitrososphaerales archaeon]|nr:sugar phosphate isomerase/epimerase [Nitrososphaerales archaeon]